MYVYVCDGSRQGISLFPHMDTLFVYDVRDVSLIHECPNKVAISNSEAVLGIPGRSL